MTNPFSTINLSTFDARVQALVHQKSRFVSSGALVVSDALSEFCKTGSGYDEQAVALARTQQWNGARLASEASEEAIANRIAEYEARRLNAVVLSILSGVFTAAADDLTFDASGDQFVMMATNFTGDNLKNAEQLVDGPNKVLFVHSAVFNRIRKNNLLDFKQDPVTGQDVWTLGDMAINWDDAMPMFKNVYHSYVLAAGALELGWDLHKTSTEVVSDVEADDHVLCRTWKYAVHPRGFGYTGVDNPANDPLAEGSSWKRVSDKATMSRLITREA
jgi:hypothetical protein